MQSNPAENIEKHFASLEDPRVERTRLHKLLDMVVITICAAIGGANDWPAVVDWAKDNQKWLHGFWELPNGIPSHDTFWRLFAALKPESFERCFSEWISAVGVMTPGEVVAIDGKFLRRSHDKGLGKGAIDMVSAWACASRLVLAQRKVDEKSRPGGTRIIAIPELLKLLELKGALVTIDAMGCQNEIAETIVEQEADYLLQLKGNQPNLHEDVALLFTDLAESNFTAYAYDIQPKRLKKLMLVSKFVRLGPFQTLTCFLISATPINLKTCRRL
jgi:predicted transposase YbfD/YdcC